MENEEIIKKCEELGFDISQQALNILKLQNDVSQHQFFEYLKNRMKTVAGEDVLKFLLKQAEVGNGS